jgi:alpha-N-acetylglucosaminidase
MTPPISDSSYLRNISKKVYQAMADADPKAVWFMQGWLFLFDSFWTQPRIDAFLSGVPNDKMVVIDLFSDAKPVWNKTNAYSGKQWIWCIINNWGGKQGIYGRLSQVGVELPKLIKNKEAGNLVGTGTLNEGNDNNPIVYEQLYEMAWRNEPMDVNDWVQKYAERRYGKKNANAQKAWLILHSTLYECKDKRHGPQGNYFSMPPSLSPTGGGFVRGEIFYNTEKVREAFKLLLDASDELANQPTYQFDLVDLGRQVMSDISQQFHKNIRNAVEKKDIMQFDKAVTIWDEAIEDCDALLRTNTMFQVGRYLQYPRRAVENDTMNAKFEENAKRLITLWYSNTDLNGYAQRQYGGLMRDLNKAAWNAYFSNIRNEMTGEPKGKDLTLQVTEQWIKEHKEYPVSGEGNPVDAARMIWRKYASKAKTVNNTILPLEIKHKE